MLLPSPPLGVGNRTDVEELKILASEPASNFTFEVNGYSALPTLKGLLAFRTCKGNIRKTEH